MGNFALWKQKVKSNFRAAGKKEKLIGIVCWIAALVLFILTIIFWI